MRTNFCHCRPLLPWDDLWPVNISGSGNDGHGCIGPSKEVHKILGRSVVGRDDSSGSGFK
jgi:hypothetical protein